MQRTSCGRQESLIKTSTLDLQSVLEKLDFARKANEKNGCWTETESSTGYKGYDHV